MFWEKEATCLDKQHEAETTTLHLKSFEGLNLVRPETQRCNVYVHSISFSSISFVFVRNDALQEPLHDEMFTALPVEPNSFHLFISHPITGFAQNFSERLAVLSFGGNPTFGAVIIPSQLHGVGGGTSSFSSHFFWFPELITPVIHTHTPQCF